MAEPKKIIIDTDPGIGKREISRVSTYIQLSLNRRIPLLLIRPSPIAKKTIPNLRFLVMWDLRKLKPPLDWAYYNKPTWLSWVDPVSNSSQQPNRGWISISIYIGVSVVICIVSCSFDAWCRWCHGNLSGTTIAGSGGDWPHNYIRKRLYNSRHKKRFALGNHSFCVIFRLDLWWASFGL